ncbi:uncharacterized protein PHACADRAFT_263510 [Phanerochaete carnosa HHB-10118-sp]|uniref:Enoyl reductase (ER) domain-containing protein n=1 Tax=Phanerochaete carnosa (strain HHB-10118-sp) TaxID=650164 RepID=K5VXT9_PHACS|nr:uncharacterized protein PHACADRAFT_263510 [Phanerochaete carnosa HHB-10118-sp]EKM51409.1 hypothetical protein PHACADRAFT_263510 [Phanerochaete carnosa HHB-10118-sp]
MSTQKALYLPELKGKLIIKERDIPEPGPGEVLIEVHAAGLNPADWKISELGILVTEYPIVLGLDSAGIVKKVGPEVTNVAVGDRVLHSGFRNVRSGTFQQYTIAPAEIIAKIPPNLTLDQAASIPLAAAAAAVGLYYRTGTDVISLTAPWEKGGRGKYAGEPILVIGGSSAVGQQVVQFARISGFSPIIATGSLHNETYLKSLGVTHVIDRDASLSALHTAVKKITAKPVKVVFDAVSFADTQNAAYEVLAPGGKLIIVLPSAVDEDKTTPEKQAVMVYSSFWGTERRELGKNLYAELTGWLEAGEIKPNNIEVLPGGLVGILSGLERLKKGISAVKLIAHPQENA